MIHIAYLIPTLDRIGGAERQLMLLATGMAHRDWRVTVIALAGSGGQAAQDLSTANVSFLSLDMPHGLFDRQGWNRLRRWIHSAQPEVLHAHLAQASLMARGIRVAAPHRVLIDTIHSPATGSASRRRAYRLTSGIPNVVTAVSRSCAQPWLDARTLHPSELSVIPNGIDTDRWQPVPYLSGEPRFSSDPLAAFRWIAIGRLDPVKDYATLLRALSMLPQSAHLTIAGSGPLEHKLRFQAADLGIQDRVQFLGFRSDLRHLMHNSDGFVLSSLWEGLPVALMEASACQLPSVFTETSGARELLPDSALPVVPVGDPVALAVSMQALMNLPKIKRLQLGRSARQRIVASFDQNSVLTRFEALYHRLLAANPHPSRHRKRAHSFLAAPVRSSTTES
jgi:glycosyltransferase involved in cell wall biosynthesis